MTADRPQDAEGQPDATWFGCLTGDCPHESSAECEAWIRAELVAQAVDAWKSKGLMQRAGSELANALARIGDYQRDVARLSVLEAENARKERAAFVVGFKIGAQSRDHNALGDEFDAEAELEADEWFAPPAAVVSPPAGSPPNE